MCPWARSPITPVQCPGAKLKYNDIRDWIFNETSIRTIGSIEYERTHFNDSGFSQHAFRYRLGSAPVWRW